MQRFRTDRYRLIFSVFYALAMTLVAFAHQPVLANAERDRAAVIALSAYVLPEGTLPSLCLGNGGDTDNRIASQGKCDACLIASAAGLPAPATHGIRLPVSRCTAWGPAPQPSPATSAPIRANAPRAPPAVSGIHMPELV